MGRYIDSSLINNEKVEYEGSFALWDNFILIIIFIIPTFGLIIPLLYVYQKFTEIAVTNNRVIGKKGIIRRQTYEYGLNKIESIEVKQSILGRIFSYGDIVLIGSGSSNLIIPAIKNPEEFKKQINTIKYN